MIAKKRKRGGKNLIQIYTEASLSETRRKSLPYKQDVSFWLDAKMFQHFSLASTEIFHSTDSLRVKKY
jgi:hypothetical protein